MNKVYVVQERMRRGDNGPTPVHDLTPAAEYGELEVLMGPESVALTPGPMVRNLRYKLRNFNDDDYILAVGDPVAIATASAIAAQNNLGRFKVLRWDRRIGERGGYVSIQVDTHV